jgi:hypothetical protein
MMAEGLFRQAIEALSISKSTPLNPYSLLTTKFRFGKVLSSVVKREGEG